MELQDVFKAAKLKDYDLEPIFAPRQAHHKDRGSCLVLAQLNGRQGTAKQGHTLYVVAAPGQFDQWEHASPELLSE